MRQRGESNTPLKFQHRRQSNFLNVQDNSESSTQNGRPRQIKNKYSRCLLDEINNSQEDKELEYQSNSQSLDQVNYGTQPEEGRESFEDYDWEQDRMIKYRMKDDGTYLTVKDYSDEFPSNSNCKYTKSCNGTSDQPRI